MPWSEDLYPSSLRHLSEFARAKAIKIANALLAEGMDEGQTIRIAMARAQERAGRRGLATRNVG